MIFSFHRGLPSSLNVPGTPATVRAAVLRCRHPAQEVCRRVFLERNGTSVSVDGPQQACPVAPGEEGPPLDQDHGEGREHGAGQLYAPHRPRDQSAGVARFLGTVHVGGRPGSHLEPDGTADQPAAPAGWTHESLQPRVPAPPTAGRAFDRQGNNQGSSQQGILA